MASKFTMFFNQGGSGFSETWYNTTDYTQQPAAGSDLEKLYTARTGLLSDAVIPMGWRLSSTVNPRLTFVSDVSKTITGNGAPDTVTNSILAIARGVGGVGRRQFWMRGLPDAWIVRRDLTGEFLPDGDWMGAFTRFNNLIKQAPWAIRTVKSLQASAAKEQVGAVANAVVGAGTVLTLRGVLADATVPILVSGFKRPLSAMNGTYLPTSGYTYTGGALTLLHKTVSAFDLASYPGGAWVRTQEFSYTSIARVSFTDARERRVGRAFFVPAGRRPRR